MKIFQTHPRIVSGYANYISCFLNIADLAIKDHVEKELMQGKLWPEPLLQFNTALEMSSTASDLAQTGVIHYDWHDLSHDFYEVGALPENDRIRYTISPAARKEVLERLLAENNRRSNEQTALITSAKPKIKRSRESQANEGQGDLFQ